MYKHIKKKNFIMQTNVISTIGWAIFTTLIVLSLSGCGGGGGGGSDFLISWDANREFSVNSPGGGYRVYYSTNPGFDISTANIVDVPFVSGPAAPTSIVIPLSSGTYYIKVVAYSTLNSAGSQPSQESSIDVP